VSERKKPSSTQLPRFATKPGINFPSNVFIHLEERRPTPKAYGVRRDFLIASMGSLLPLAILLVACYGTLCTR
jgi:hypothetical protein